MKRISKVAGAIDTGGGGRMGLAAGGRAAGPPVALLVTEALMKRPNSSDGHVVNRPARRETAASRAGQRRRGRNRGLTIGARCSVISTDCIQNVDDSQPLTAGILPQNNFRGARRTAAGGREGGGGRRCGSAGRGGGRRLWAYGSRRVASCERGRVNRLRVRCTP